MNIIGKKVILRALEPEDMELLRDTINDPEIEQRVIGWSFPVSKVEQMRWYERTLEDKSNRRFVIEAIDESVNCPIGVVYLTDIDWKNRIASTGIKIFKNSLRRNGYATDALRALHSYAFNELQLHRIQFRILCDNAASIGLHEKCGAKREGVMREAIFKGGKYLDVYMYGLLKSDFEEAQKE